MSINDDFVQRSIRAVELLQTTVGIFMRIDSGVILIGDGNMTRVLSDSRRNIEVLGFKVVCGKLRYYNFINFRGHVFQWRINTL